MDLFPGQVLAVALDIEAVYELEHFLEVLNRIELCLLPQQPPDVFLERDALLGRRKAHGLEQLLVQADRHVLHMEVIPHESCVHGFRVDFRAV
jgi:hypothetical protein